MKGRKFEVLKKGANVSLAYLSSGGNYKMFENQAIYKYKTGNNLAFTFPDLSYEIWLNLSRILFIKSKGNDTTAALSRKGDYGRSKGFKREK